MSELQHLQNVNAILDDIADVKTNSIVIACKTGGMVSVLLAGNPKEIQIAIKEAMQQNEQFAVLVHDACLDYDINNMNPN